LDSLDDDADLLWGWGLAGGSDLGDGLGDEGDEAGFIERFGK